MTDQEPPVDDVQKAGAMYGTGERGPFENTDMSGRNSKYAEWTHTRNKERDAEAEKKVDAQSVTATAEYNKDPVVKESRKKVDEAKATMTPEEAAEVEDAESEHVDNVFQERAQAAEAARIQGVKDRAQAAAEARANEEHVDPFQNSDYVPPTEEEVAKRKEEQLRQRDEYNDQVFQDEQARKEEEFYNENDPNKEGVLDPKGQSAREWEERQRAKIEEGREGMGPGENLEEAEARRKKEADEAERQRKQEEYNAMVNSDDPNVRLKTVEGLANERNEIAMQHMKKMVNAFAQTAAEMGGQMASKGWDLAGNIVKMTFTQPHVMSSTSRMIGTAMSALQTAGDFADRSVQKYGIDVNADPNLMKNTIRYKLYKREAEMGKNTVGNTFRTISESLGNMGLQDASQMTPDQLDQHVQDMRAEADRLTQALKDPKLSNSERSLIKAQAQHLQGYMDGLAKQGAGMAQDQRIAARRQKRQDLATRRQNYQVLADGSPNPYREALEWADPRFGIEVDPQTGRPTNPSAYNRMLNAVITQRQNEAAAAARAGKKLDPAREKWFSDLQNKIYNDIQAMKQDKAENPLRGRAEIYARIGRVAPGFEKYIDNIEQTGTHPSNSTQSTRAIRKVLSDYLFELKDKGLEKTPEYNHALAFLTSMDKYNNMKKLMSRIAGVMPHGAERAKRIHEATENDPYVKEDFSDNGKIKDYMKLVEAYANLMKVLPRDPVGGGKFDPEDKLYQQKEGIFNDNLTYFVNKWFPGAGWSIGGDDEEDDGDIGGIPPGGGTPGGSDDDNEDVDRFISEAFQYLFGDGGAGGGGANPKVPKKKVPRAIVPKTTVPKTPKGPKITYAYNPPITEKDKQFQAQFYNWKKAKETLKRLGHITDDNPIMTPEAYTRFRDNFIKAGGSPETFDSSPFTRHMPFELRSPVEQVIFDLDGSLRPAKQRRNPKVTVKDWKNRMREALSEDGNKEILDLMVKNAQGMDLTDEEKEKVMQFMIQNKFRKSKKTVFPGKKDAEQEQPETPVEEEAGGENDILPSVRSNNIIPFEVSSQFKKRDNIENINAGLEAINDEMASPEAKSEGYNNLLFGLTDELGVDAVLKDYPQLVRDGLLNGSTRSMQMMADSAQDPDEKLKIYLASRFAAPGSNTVYKNITDFFNQNKGQYDSTAYTPYLNRITEELKKDPTPEKRAEIVNSILDGDLDPSFKLHKEGEKSGDETPSEEEAVDPAKFAEEVVGSFDPSLFSSGEKDEVPADQNGTDQFESEVPPEEQTVEEPEKESTGPETVESFEQDDNSPKGLFFPENSPYKDFKTMAEAMGEELGITIHTKQEKARDAIDSWLTSHGIGYEDGVDADSLKDEIVTYLRKNGLISTKKDTDRKDKDRKVDPVLEEAKSALAEGPAADKDSISKDKRKVNDFKKRIRKKYADERDRTRVLGLFDDFMKDYEANLKEQYSNHGDMAWRAQAIADFLKWEQLSLEDRKKLTPREKSGKKNGDKNNKASDEEIHYTPLDDVPKYDPSKRDDFINELGEFGKYASEGRLKGAYIATVGAHDKALNTIQSAISDIDKEIAQRENSRGKEGWTLQDEDNLEGLYNQRSVLGDKKRSWEKSKELVEYNDKFANVYGVFSELSDRARNNEAVSADELKSLEDGISTLNDDDQKMFAPLMDYLKSKTSKFIKDSYIKDYAALQKELEKLKNDSESLKKERDLDEVKSSIDEMFEGFKAGHLEVNKETSKTVEDLIEKLPNKEKDAFNKKFEEIKKNDLRNRIRKEGGFKEGSDPTKWLKEISECTDADTLNKKVRAYEHYIESLPKNAKKGEQKSLDRAKDRADALINPRSRDEVAAELIKKIQENGYHEFDVNAEKYEQQLLGGNLSEKEQIKARQLWTKIQEVREISKTLEDKFGVSYSDFTSDKAQNGVQNDMWKILSDKVREAYKKGDEGSGLAQEYKLLIKKMHLKPAEEDLATRLLNAAIPKEQTTKSLSVRDLFRARNPDWE